MLLSEIEVAPVAPVHPGQVRRDEEVLKALAVRQRRQEEKEPPSHGEDLLVLLVLPLAPPARRRGGEVVRRESTSSSVLELPLEPITRHSLSAQLAQHWHPVAQQRTTDGKRAGARS